MAGAQHGIIEEFARINRELEIVKKQLAEIQFPMASLCSGNKDEEQREAIAFDRKICEQEMCRRNLEVLVSIYKTAAADNNYSLRNKVDDKIKVGLQNLIFS